MGWTCWPHLERGRASYHLTDAREETSAVSLSPAPPLVAGRLFHSGPEVCLPLCLSLPPPSPGAEFRLRGVGSKGSDRGAESWDGDGDKLEALGGLHLQGAGGGQSLWAPRPSAASEWQQQGALRCLLEPPQGDEFRKTLFRSPKVVCLLTHNKNGNNE